MREADKVKAPATSTGVQRSVSACPAEELTGEELQAPGTIIPPKKKAIKVTLITALPKPNLFPNHDDESEEEEVDSDKDNEKQQEKRTKENKLDNDEDDVIITNVLNMKKNIKKEKSYPFLLLFQCSLQWRLIRTADDYIPGSEYPVHAVPSKIETTSIQPEVHTQPPHIPPQPLHVNLQPPQIHSQLPHVHLQPPQIHLQPQHVHLQPQQVHLQPQQVHLQPLHVHLQPQQVHLQLQQVHLQLQQVHLQLQQPPIQPNLQPVPVYYHLINTVDEYWRVVSYEPRLGPTFGCQCLKTLCRK